MGNSPSARRTTSLCEQLFGSSEKVDEGEWFGTLPRKKGSRKKSKPTKTPHTRRLEQKPHVGTDSRPRPSQRSLTKTTHARHLEQKPHVSFDLNEDDDVAAPASPMQYSSLGPDTTKVTPTPKTRKEPSVKLTFVNGQFVDLSTEKGQAIVNASTSGVACSSSSGIVASVDANHCGIMGRSSSAGDDVRKLARQRSGHRHTLPNLRMLHLHRETSDDSGATASISSRTSSETSSPRTSSKSLSSQSSCGSLGFGATDPVVSSMVTLGERHFLTASKSDQVIKLWRGEKKTIQFVRDFVGHRTGITCLAKVDEKGRFLSASKDKVVKLWDSRFNCGDEDDSERTLLATFANTDSKSTLMMTVVDAGSYVRPTDNVDTAMVTAMAKMTIGKGAHAVQLAAKERQVISCTCRFATITKRHGPVKVWSVREVEQKALTVKEVKQKGRLMPEGENVAESRVEQELEHDAVVEAVASAPGMLLTGDRLGTVRLWQSDNHLLDFNHSNGKFKCVRTFAWRHKSELSTIKESMRLGITSLAFLQGNFLFVSGSKGGDLRVWKIDGTKQVGETVKKEAALVKGAPSAGIVAVQQGPQTKDEETELSFSFAAEDGKVLSFAVPVGKRGTCKPRCFDVFDHRLAERYMVDAEPACTGALVRVHIEGKDMLVSGTDDGRIHLLSPHRGKRGHDALLHHHQVMEEEARTLRAIAEACAAGGVETSDRIHMARTYKNVFLGKDLISYLVNQAHAASREDAVVLAHILEVNLSLFQCATKKGQPLEDSTKPFYRWSGHFAADGPIVK